MSQLGGKESVPGIPGLKKYQQTPIKDGTLFSLAQSKGRSGKFMAHLLGLDHEQASNPHAKAAGTGAANHPLKGLKLKELFHGVKFTPNFMFFLLFLGFFLWLFVIYWVRHHEPLADQVLGTPKARSERTAADRQLVAGIKEAFPIKTSATTGEIYVPGSEQALTPQAAVPVQPGTLQPSYGNQYANAGVLITSPAMGASQYGTSQPTSSSPYGTAQPSSSSPYAPAPSTQLVSAADQSMSPVQAGQGNYFVQSNAGTRVKTIVSR